MSQKTKKFFLVGPPNSGKTSLFNWLTGFQNPVVNYPGSTALFSEGNILKKYQLPGIVVDSPGFYSLFPQSENEQQVQKLLFKNKDPRILILTLDVSKLEIQLPLFFQLKEAGFSPVLALTMWDIKPSPINLSRLKKLLKTPVIPIKGLTGEGVMDLIEILKNWIPEQKPKPIKAWDLNKFKEISRQTQNLISPSSKKDMEKEKKQSFFADHRWDKLFLHPQKGLLLFAGIMLGLFSSIFWLAQPFMEFIDKAFSLLIDQSFKSLAIYPQIADFVSHGLLASLAGVLIFVPQIFILFAGISLLEDTGYLARAVALMDGPFSKIGLSGRSFVPFLSGYACAVPSVLLARNLDSQKERWMNFLAIPFMTCSARLPVYILLLSFLFYSQSAFLPALTLGGIYMASFFLGISVVWLLNLFFKKQTKEAFLLDLPLYRPPILKKILRNAYMQSRHYIVKAGPTIFFVALVIWLLCHFPGQSDLPPAERIQQSYAGQIGQWIEPAFKAMGVDWRVGTALIAAFAAREVFVPALALVFSLAPEGNAPLKQSLIESMQKAQHADGSLIFTFSSVTALVVFFIFSLQCLSTTAVVYKESGSWRLALFQFLALNGGAYLMAVCTYQGLEWLLSNPFFGS